ncbi:MAG: nucleotidyl transferase AbiEii/AbiGii toxin family protein [bacterium]|nr:nucleotidyl transferase AbiEii/AbiGii toxin family protein [bacterium]
MHLEAITSEQKRIFERLKNFPEYCLAGGTALALQIGHRLSIDFDFFSDKKIPPGLLQEVEKAFKDYKREIIVNNPEQLTAVLNGIHLTFVKYSFPIIFKLKEHNGVKLFSVQEIAAIKAYVLGRRATKKDYVDLYFILKGKHLTLPKLIDICQKKYGREFEPRLFLEQLVYLKDIKDTEIIFLGEKIGKAKMEEFFKKAIGQIKL